jgi:hypothetical protein
MARHITAVDMLDLAVAAGMMVAGGADSATGADVRPVTSPVPGSGAVFQRFVRLIAVWMVAVW